LHCAEPKELNDPFDASISVKFDSFSYDDIMKFTENRKGDFETLRWALVKNDESIEKIRELLSYVFLKEYFSDIRICSFSSDYNNPLMWAHYAENYTGVCIGYKTTSDGNKDYIETDDNCMIQIEKVKYKKTEGKIIYEPKPKLKSVREKLFLIKSYPWKYESEYRLVNNTSLKSTLFLKDDTIEEIIFGTKTTYIDHNLVKLVSKNHNNSIRYSKIEITNNTLEKINLTTSST
jgi:hypothetical protein